MEVIPGIHKLKLQLPFREYVNVYIIYGKEGLTLVDTGFETPDSISTLERELAELKLGLKDISRVIITHSHLDHSGMAERLKQLSQAKLALHELEIAGLDAVVKIPHEEAVHFIGSLGAPEDIEMKLVEIYSFFKNSITSNLTKPEIVLRGGEIISIGSFDFEVLWTPGHSPGHICLYEPSEKIMLSGDHILPITTPIIGSYPWLSWDPLADYINSLEAMKELGVSLVLPGHEHVFENFRERIEELIQHHEMRKANILEILENKSKSAYEVATEITWMPQFGGVRWQNLNLMDRWMGILETLAHLKTLKAEGKISEKIRNGVGFYTTSA